MGLSGLEPELCQGRAGLSLAFMFIKIDKPGLQSASEEGRAFRCKQQVISKQNLKRALDFLFAFR